MFRLRLGYLPFLIKAAVAHELIAARKRFSTLRGGDSAKVPSANGVPVPRRARVSHHYPVILAEGTINEREERERGERGLNDRRKRCVGGAGGGDWVRF